MDGPYGSPFRSPPPLQSYATDAPPEEDAPEVRDAPALAAPF